ncbi:amylo-alpha-1,6-glucosidase [Halomicroarcula sp. GCM10025709]|uniref:amylo-alpha-1,6-glucosidase n=1 Tax=Halomicroarcula sp. GCM10025709 TaxID=3252669 RepID=UPI00360D1EAB
MERRFDDQFWLPDRSFYGLAKTGAGDIVDAVTSNVGHCLWTGLVPEARAGAVVETLQQPELADSWGIRTMSATDAGYSPVSYHAGGVWPHDTSLVAVGLGRYGYGDVAERIGRHVLVAGARTRHERLPELYCGFDRETAPTPYPATCVPQAWGAGAPFALLRAAFGLSPADDGTVVSTRSSSLFPERALDPVRDRWGGVERRR